MSDPISRRKAITGAVAGGALVWAAPTIVSTSAASAATVPPEDLNVVQNPSFEIGSSGLTAPSWAFA